MGLDVTAYEHVELVEARTYSSMSDDNWDELYDSDLVFLSNEMSCFMARSAGWENGIYRHSGGVLTKHHSYGGYSHFREQVAVAALNPYIGPSLSKTFKADDPRLEEMLLAEWIWFSDCEGYLAGPVCERLANASKLVEFKPSDDWDADSWDDWKAIFDLTAGDGAIDYH